MKLKLTYPITLSHHGAYKQYNKMTLWLQKFITDHWDKISSMFTLPDEIEVRLRPLPNRSKNGSAHWAKRLVEIDVSTNSIHRMLQTLMHELRHIEQYHTGRLAQRAEGKHWIYYWDGVRQGRGVHASVNHDAYQAQPWEVDARTAQEFVDKLIEMGVVIPDGRNIE